MKKFTLLSLAAASMLVSVAAKAEDYVITLKGDKFEPAELTIPADTKVVVTVKNANEKTMEFESHDFKREKIIKGNGEAKVNVGPLKAGTYNYFDEFQKDVNGKIVVK